MSKSFSTATFRELRLQNLSSGDYAVAIKFDVFKGGQQIVCFINGEGVLRQLEEAIPGIKEEIKKVREELIASTIL